MPLDPSISLGVRPVQAPNMLGMYAEIAGLQNAQQQNALAKLQYDTAVRQAEDDRATSDAFRSSGGDLTQTRNALTQRGLYKQAMSLDEKLRAMKKDELETATKEADLAKKRLDAFSGLIAPLANKQDVTHDEVFEIGKRAEAMGLLPKGWEGSVPMNSMQLPGFLRSVALSTEQGRKSIEMLLPRLKDAGGSFINENPLSADYLKPVVAKTATPGDLLTDTRTREEGEKNRDLTRRGQNMLDARAKETNTITAGGRSREDADNLRKEFEGKEAVKAYRNVVPIAEAARSAPDTRAGDIQMAYAVGKILDPNSVVREGELKLTDDAATLPEKIQGEIRTLVYGKGRMTPETRKQIQQILDNAVTQRKGAYEAERAGVEAIVQRRGYNPDDVFLPTPKPKTPAAASPKAPKVGAVEDGYRFKGGDPNKPESWEKV